MADRLNNETAQVAGALRDSIEALPANQRATAISIARQGIRLGIAIARGEVLPGDNFEKVRDVIENTMTGDRNQWQA